jgi:hypothetical protein
MNTIHLLQNLPVVFSPKQFKNPFDRRRGRHLQQQQTHPLLVKSLLLLLQSSLSIKIK